MKCKVLECDVTGPSSKLSKGYCQKHYQRLRRIGRLDLFSTSEKLSRRKRCKVDGCDRVHGALGYCSLHYRRFLRKQKDPRSKIECHIDKLKSRVLSCRHKDPNACWDWKWSLADGYGRISIDKKKDGIHRFSYSMFRGEIPKGMFVCHKCDNRKCVNPEHLFVGTARDNQQDMIAKGRKIVFRGESAGTSKLTEQNVKAIRFSYKNGVSQLALAKQYNVSKATISSVYSRHSWAHVK